MSQSQRLASTCTSNERRKINYSFRMTQVLFAIVLLLVQLQQSDSSSSSATRTSNRVTSQAATTRRVAKRKNASSIFRFDDTNVAIHINRRIHSTGTNHPSLLSVMERLRGGSSTKSDATSDTDSSKNTNINTTTAASNEKKKSKKKKKTTSTSSSSSNGNKKPQAPKKKKKKSTTKRKNEEDATTKDTELEKEKEVLTNALKEKDSAQALGDAIRNRADILTSSDLLESISQSIQSVGMALGSSDRRKRLHPRNSSRKTKAVKTETSNDASSSSEGVTATITSFQFNGDVEDEELDMNIIYDDGIGSYTDASSNTIGMDGTHADVDIPTTSVIVNYFMKSHGGAHALQFLCSLFASIAGLGSILFSCTTTTQSNNMPLLCLTLVKRCLFFAMIKHISGLLAAATLAARAIPEIGLKRSKLWIQQLTLDPVSQYLFYSACVSLWLPSSSKATHIFYKQKNPLLPALLVGPILIREVISTALVISDVLVLTTACSGSTKESDSSMQQMLQKIVKLGRSLMNQFMSLLVTAKVWETSDAIQRQVILATLTSHVSLLLEMIVGVLFLLQVGWITTKYFFAPISTDQPRPNILNVISCYVYTHGYFRFLWMIRKQKITNLFSENKGSSPSKNIKEEKA